MRFILHLLALVALMVAPLAAPAAAMAATQTASECTNATMDMGGHDKPASEHSLGQACCVAVPPAIDPPLTAVAVVVELDHLAFIAANAPFRLGAGPKAEDPPPRFA